jgi:hypothetical protein
MGALCLAWIGSESCTTPLKVKKGIAGFDLRDDQLVLWISQRNSSHPVWARKALGPKKSGSWEATLPLLAENVLAEARAPTGRTVTSNPTLVTKCDQNWLPV